MAQVTRQGEGNVNKVSNHVKCDERSNFFHVTLSLFVFVLISCVRAQTRHIHTYPFDLGLNLPSELSFGRQLPIILPPLSFFLVGLR